MTPNTPRTDPGPFDLCFFGAAGDTGNHGVSALMHSTLAAVACLAPSTRVTVFDNGWGMRPARAEYAGGPFEYRLCGARLSRRFHRPESYFHMRLTRHIGGLGNPGMRALLASDAVWDISAGDSFADLYGKRHLRAMLAPKRLALACGIPLVLLPQTYGPYTRAASRRQVAAVLRACRLAWARDEDSLGVLRDLLGADFDPQRHRAGVDVAFGLEIRAPAQPLAEPVASWLDSRGGPPTVGLNVSGLLFNDPQARARFGLATDYRAALVLLAGELLRKTEARLLLVPHVLPPSGSIESDLVACRALRESLAAGLRPRVEVLPAGLDASETKYIVSRLDWFSGARMHACIGALSSGIPTGGVAYSPKMRGVFATCGQSAHVADLRSLRTEELVAALWASWEARAEARATLASRLPAVIERARSQMRETLAASRRREGALR
jgi:polysaccharide pyruvyl transferase WcaK-like protein